MSRHTPQLTPQRKLVALLGLVCVLFCSAALVLYAQGSDPLAFLGSSTAQTQVSATDAATRGATDSHAATAATDVQSQEQAASSQDGGSTAESQESAASESEQSKVGAASGEKANKGQSSNASSGPGQAAAGSSASEKGAASDEANAVSSGAKEGAQPPADTRIKVSVVVDGSRAGGFSGGYLVTLEAGASAFDALAATGVSYNARQTVYGTYVSAIEGLAEFAHGGQSGWVYAVGGAEPQTAASNYTVHDGDRVVWTYVNVE